MAIALTIKDRRGERRHSDPEQVRIGRDPAQAQLVLESEYVSRLHCVVIRRSNGEWVLIHRGRNPSWVDGKALRKPGDQVTLKLQSVLTLGGVRIELEIDDEPVTQLIAVSADILDADGLLDSTAPDDDDDDPMERTILDESIPEDAESGGQGPGVAETRPQLPRVNLHLLAQQPPSPATEEPDEDDLPTRLKSVPLVRIGSIEQLEVPPPEVAGMPAPPQAITAVLDRADFLAFVGQKPANEVGNEPALGGAPGGTAASSVLPGQEASSAQSVAAESAGVSSSSASFPPPASPPTGRSRTVSLSGVHESVPPAKTTTQPVQPVPFGSLAVDIPRRHGLLEALSGGVGRLLGALRRFLRR